MLNFNKIKFIGWGISAVLLVCSCSPSSYSSRYDKPKEKEEKSRDNSTRFTSQDDKEKIDSESSSKPSDEISFKNLPPGKNTEFDDEPYEEYPVDTKEFVSNYSKLRNLGVQLTGREKILFEIIKYLETPYQYGGESFNGIDCSAFTQQVFKSSLNEQLPRTASEQFLVGSNVTGLDNLKFGDLVFFDTQKVKFPGHVGIYVGNDLFAHSSSSRGVTVSSLQSSYYKDRYVGAKRFDYPLQ